MHLLQVPIYFLVSLNVAVERIERKVDLHKQRIDDSVKRLEAIQFLTEQHTQEINRKLEMMKESNKTRYSQHCMAILPSLKP